MIFFDEVGGAVIKLVAVGLIRKAHAIVPIPAVVDGPRLVEVGAGCVALLVKILRVEAVPPFAFSVGFRQFAVVGHSGQRTGLVGALGDFIPAPCVRSVQAHAERQPLIVRGLRPAGDQIFLRADRHGIPRLVGAVPQVEVVVVVAQLDEVLGAGPFIEGHEFFRIPVLGLP